MGVVPYVGILSAPSYSLHKEVVVIFLVLTLVIAVASNFRVKVCSFFGKKVVKMQMGGNN